MLLYHAGFGNESLTSATKEKAIQCVLFHQVFKSRRDQIDDLKDGLNSGFLLRLPAANTSCVPVAFPLSNESVIKSEDILRLIKLEDDLTHKQVEVGAWFSEYVNMLNNEDYNQHGTRSAITSQPKLKDLVQFICGSPHLPSDGKGIKVKFTNGQLPDAESCFSTIKLPLNNSNYDDFCRNLNIAINCQHQGYGRG